MAQQQGKHSGEPSEPAAVGTATLRLPEQSQIDFELGFFARILELHPDFIDVLRVHGNNLSLKGRYADGLAVDKRLVHLRPDDPLAYYNLACSYALLKKNDLALKTLRHSIELGYRDFRYMREDHDLDSIRPDPRFRQLLREFESK